MKPGFPSLTAMGLPVANERKEIMPMMFEQQPKESAKAFAAFRTYLGLGPERSLVAVRSVQGEGGSTAGEGVEEIDGETDEGGDQRTQEDAQQELSPFLPPPGVINPGHDVSVNAFAKLHAVLLAGRYAIVARVQGLCGGSSRSGAMTGQKTKGTTCRSALKRKSRRA